MIVKLKLEAVSYGLRVVRNEKDLGEAVAFIVEEFQQQALVERFIRAESCASECWETAALLNVFQSWKSIWEMIPYSSVIHKRMHMMPFF